jgi:hypothetical protein
LSIPGDFGRGPRTFRQVKHRGPIAELVIDETSESETSPRDATMNLDDSSLDKPWRLVTEAGKTFATVDLEDARRIAEAVGFVEQGLLKAMSLARQGNTPMALQGFQQVQLVLNHWATEAYSLAEKLGGAQDEEDTIGQATEG